MGISSSQPVDDPPKSTILSTAVSAIAQCAPRYSESTAHHDNGWTLYHVLKLHHPAANPR